jgi:hypothetical protein
VTPTLHENSKTVLHIHNVTGDVRSFMREVQLLAGPYYEVKSNLVGTVVYVHQTPKSRVNEVITTKIKDWLIGLGF